MKFRPLTDEQWRYIEPLLPPQPRAEEGKPRAGQRRAIDTILYVLKISNPWNDLPKEY
jgi:transposase